MEAGVGIEVRRRGDWLMVAVAVSAVAAMLVGAARGAAPARRPMLLGFAAGTVSALTAALTKSSVALLDEGAGAVLAHWQPYALVAVGVMVAATVSLARSPLVSREPDRLVHTSSASWLRA
jgi:hypothetical protein